jgi:hypothetical protein
MTSLTKCPTLGAQVCYVVMESSYCEQGEALSETKKRGGLGRVVSMVLWLYCDSVENYDA